MLMSPRSLGVALGLGISLYLLNAGRPASAAPRHRIGGTFPRELRSLPDRGNPLSQVGRERPNFFETGQQQLEREIRRLQRPSAPPALKIDQRVPVPESLEVEAGASQSQTKP
jgi:hypothetical protein